MEYGYKQIAYQTITLIQEVTASEVQESTNYGKIPMIRFEDQQLTSFSGLLIFQLPFKRLNLKQCLKKCFTHLDISAIFGRNLIVLLLIIHFLIGFLRLREIDYYRVDPIVLLLMGLRKLPASGVRQKISIQETIR